MEYNELSLTEQAELYSLMQETFFKDGARIVCHKCGKVTVYNDKEAKAFMMRREICGCGQVIDTIQALSKERNFG